jgi:hypothetical protein
MDTRMLPTHDSGQRGMVLAVVLVLVALLMVLLAGFGSLTAIEMATARSSM